MEGKDRRGSERKYKRRKEEVGNGIVGWRSGKRGIRDVEGNYGSRGERRASRRVSINIKSFSFMLILETKNFLDPPLLPEKYKRYENEVWVDEEAGGSCATCQVQKDRVDEVDKSQEITRPGKKVFSLTSHRLYLVMENLSTFEST